MFYCLMCSVFFIYGITKTKNNIKNTIPITISEHRATFQLKNGLQWSSCLVDWLVTSVTWNLAAY